LVTLSELRGQLRGVVENVVDGAALTLEHGDEGLRKGVDLVRVQRPEHRLETTDQRVEVQRGRGPRHRDESARRQDPVGAVAVATLELEVAVADQVEITDLGGRRLIHRHRAVDVELHPRPLAAVDQLDIADLADLDAGSAYELAWPQAAGVAELRGIGVGAVEADLPEHDEDHHGEEQQHNREEAEFEDGTGDFHGLIVLSPT
jgi:hypothetical protein